MSSAQLKGTCGAITRHTLAKISNVIRLADELFEGILHTRLCSVFGLFLRRLGGRIVVLVQALAPDLDQAVKGPLALLPVDVRCAWVFFRALLS
jgi:hypothetical protein